MPKKKSEPFFHKLYSKFDRQSLFVKYFSVFAVLILICFIVLEVTLGVFVANHWTSQTKKLLADNAQSVADTTEKAIGAIPQTDTPAAIAMICSNLSLISDAIGADIYIVKPDGNLLLCRDLITPNFAVTQDGTCPLHGKFQVPAGIMEKALQGEYFERGTLGGVYLEKQLIAAEPVSVNGQNIGVVFAVAPTMSGFKDYTTTVLKMFLFATLVALAVGFIAIYFFTVSLIKPLKEMSQATKAYAQGDFRPRIHATGNDELTELVNAFNKMASDMALLESSRRSFVANVSHELKTPMTTIGGFIDGILDGTIPPEKEKHYLQIVSDETKRLARLVVTMLNLSKIEAGELKLNPRQFDISSDVFQILLTFEQAVEKKHIAIAGLDELHPLLVTADEDMIHQVIYNLLDNAVKFTENGTLSISAKHEEKGVTVRIRNTGTGISQEELSKIFERFYKVDKSRSYDVKGAGLGLYICKTIIEMHGGQIGCNSQEGDYTEFWFSLPTNAEEQKI